jgi:hypothetical protein
MKNIRLITLTIIVMLVISAWTPAPVSASAYAGSDASAAYSIRAKVKVEPAKPVNLTINNKTGGAIFVSLQGTQSYSFTAPVGKTKYQIMPGRYTYTVRASACNGVISKTKNFRGGGSLGPYVCH